METKNFWFIARDLAISCVIMMLLPLLFERGVALLHLSVVNGLLLQRMLGLAALVAGTFVHNAALSIGLIVGGFWTMVPLALFVIYGVSAKFFVILVAALAALIRALIVWDREWLENKF